MTLLAVVAAAVLAGCAAGPQPPPYPAFVKTELAPEQFLASLPGVRARQFGGDPQLRTVSARIDLPSEWQGTTGGSPGKSLEIFVLAGRLRFADVDLGPGGYAYVPPGSLGFNMASDDGARILYFREDVDPAALIRTPIILDSAIVDWVPTDRPRHAIKELRQDPGSGERTWLLRIAAGTKLPWTASSSRQEGVLVTGQQAHVECVAGEPYKGTYLAGGFFNRPAGTVHGGPDSSVIAEAVWFLRESAPGKTSTVAACGAD